MIKQEKTILTGKVKENPYGNWEDVDKGWYIGWDNILNVLWDFKNKNVRITVEEITEEEVNND